MSQAPLQQLARKLKIKKEEIQILMQALTHKSYLGETEGLKSNERLEFLGDSILGLVVAEYLFKKYADKPEGDLAKAKAVSVSEPILAEAAKKIGVPDAIFVSAGEEASGGRERPSILADAFEAIVAAVYLARGIDAAREFILKTLGPILNDIEREEYHRNYKSVLQELSQSLLKKAPKYRVVAESGADHDKTFLVEAIINETLLGRGTGKSKKQAEQAAAFEALKHPLFQKEQDS